MDKKIINQQLNKLPIITSDDFFLKYKPTLNEEYAQSLVGKLIYFTWYHNLDNEKLKEELSGKVLEYKDNNLVIYTHYVLMLEEDLNNPNNLQDNEFIKEIPLEDITNIAEFANYRFEGWETIPNDYYGNIYEITNMQGTTITAIAYNFDGNYLHLAYKNNTKISTNKYPISLISKMTPVLE